MNNKLITLNGESTDNLIPVDVHGKSDVVAGIIFFSFLKKYYPNLNFSDLFPRNELGFSIGKLWRKGKSATYEVLFEKPGEVISSVVDYTGKKAGSAIRLFSDEEVKSAVLDYYAAYQTYGGSEISKDWADKLSPAAKKVLASAGQGLKNALNKDGSVKESTGFENIDMNKIVVAGVGILAIALIMKKK